MFRTPKGTTHTPLLRRLLSGKRVDRTHEGPRPSGSRTPYTRQPGAGATRAALLFADVPQRTVVAADVAGPVPGQQRRRDRRSAARAARRPQPTGGGYCPCSGVTDFYSDDDREQWEQQHAECDEQVSA